MQNYNIYIIDDDKRKRVLLPILVDMLNENATHNGFEFHDGFCGDSDSRHKDPEFLINAFDDDYGVFLLDLSFSVEVVKYKSAYEKLKDIMRTDNENNFSEIDKQYNRYKEIWPEDQWDFIAWLLAVCKIKKNKKYLIKINKNKF